MQRTTERWIGTARQMIDVTDRRVQENGGEPRRHPDPKGWRPTPSQLRFALIFAMWAAAMFATCWALGSERVPAGTTVAGIDIGGLDREPAIDALNQAMGTHSRRVMKLKVAGRTVRASAEDVGIALDAEGTVDRLRTHRLNPFDVLRHWFGGGDSNPDIHIDERLAKSELGRVVREAGDPMQEPRVTYDGRRPVVRAGRAGPVLRDDDAIRALASTFHARDSSISIPTAQNAPTVSDQAAQDVANTLAARAVSAPVTLAAGDSQVVVPPELIAKALVFEVRKGELQPQLDAALLHRSLQPQLAQVETPVRDAGWDVSGSQPVLTPSQDGRGAKDEELKEAVLGAIDREGSDRVGALDLAPLHPKRTTSEAQALGIVERMASFTQEFPYAAYRVQNIGLAARKVDGTVLDPGDTFSLNETVGERTAEAGFARGTVVGEGGRFREDLGGGVSTAATALWTAAFYGGLERVEQGAHMIWISRYRPGLEATVYWGQLDLKFRNDTPHGVLISAQTTNTSITITIWGKRQYDGVEARFGKREDVRPFATVTDDAEDCEPQGGVDGFDTWVDRVFIRGGEEVKKQRFTTHYIPSNAVRCTRQEALQRQSQRPAAAPSASR